MSVIDMRRNIVLVLCLSAMLIASGCRSLLNIQEPDYEILRVVPRVSLAFPLERSTIDLEFLVEIDNPNTFALNLDRIDFDVFIDGREVIQGVSNREIRVPAQGVGEVVLSTRLTYDSIREIFREVAEVVRGGDADYQLKGKAWYRTRLGNVSLPFEIRR